MHIGKSQNAAGAIFTLEAAMTSRARWALPLCSYLRKREFRVTRRGGAG